MSKHYPLFQTPIDLAHKYWKALVKPGDTVIDATCGKGRDSLALAQMALTPHTGKLFAFDVQKQAINIAAPMLLGKLGSAIFQRITFIHGCHSLFPNEIQSNTVRLAAYNLGYLPGGDQSRTTLTETTMESIAQALELIQKGGLVSITCYPGHVEGKREESRILEYSASLDPKQWSCCFHRWCNRSSAPSLLLIQKRMAE